MWPNSPAWTAWPLGPCPLAAWACGQAARPSAAAKRERRASALRAKGLELPASARAEVQATRGALISAGGGAALKEIFYISKEETRKNERKHRAAWPQPLYAFIFGRKNFASFSTPPVGIRVVEKRKRKGTRGRKREGRGDEKKKERRGKGDEEKTRRREEDKRGNGEEKRRRRGNEEKTRKTKRRRGNEEKTRRRKEEEKTKGEETEEAKGRRDKEKTKEATKTEETKRRRSKEAKKKQRSEEAGTRTGEQANRRTGEEAKRGRTNQKNIG